MNGANGGRGKPPDFGGLRMLVVGDLMLDRYISGEVNRISPEAPVPVVNVTGERLTAGGGGNVALNLAGLGVHTLVAGAIGADEGGSSLRDLLNAQQVDTSGIVIEATRPTTTKTRVICGSHQIVRIDREQRGDVSEATTEQLRQQVFRLLDHAPQGVILSDYAKGALTESFIKFVIGECRRRSIPVFVDPKRDDYRTYAGATCLTPNLREFQAAVRFLALSTSELAAAGAALRERIGVDMLLVTQGAEGMTLVTRGAAQHLPALAEEVFDVSGAGDTVVATYAAALCRGYTPREGLELSNLAASIVVRKIGTAPILLTELEQELAATHAGEESLLSGKQPSPGAALAVV